MKKILAFSILLLFSKQPIQAQSEVVDLEVYNRSIELYNQARELMELGDYSEALQKCNDALVLYDGNSDALLLRSRIFSQREDFELAVQDILEAISYAPGQSDFHYAAGTAYFRLNDFVNAIDQYEKALALNEESEVKINVPNTYYNLGVAQLTTGQYEQAIKSLEIVTNEDGEFAEAFYNIGMAYKRIENMEAACSNFSAASNLGLEAGKRAVDSNCRAVNYPDISEQNDVIDFNLDAVISKNQQELNNQPFESFGLYGDTIFLNSQFEFSNSKDAEYYRIGQFNLYSGQFEGEFTDYYVDGMVLASGQYDLFGNKHGEFTIYTATGKLYSKGSYNKDKMAGTWNYYHTNGMISESINFIDDSFIVIEASNEDGRRTVKNGNGKWTKNLGSYYSPAILKAQFKDGKRSGKWVYTVSGQRITETYKEGQIIDSYKSPLLNLDEYSSESYFTSSLFDVTIFGVFESFSREKAASLKYSGISQKNENKGLPDGMPSYPGGLSRLYQFIAQNLIYPKESRRKGIQGVIVIQFTISEDGEMINFECIKGEDPGLIKESIRVLDIAPPWDVPENYPNGNLLEMALPITFKLG